MNRHTIDILLVAACGMIACDVASADPGSRREAVYFDEEGHVTDEESPIAGEGSLAGVPEGGDPAVPPSLDLEANVRPLTEEPACGIPLFSTVWTNNCQWERNTATSGTGVQVDCDSANEVVMAGTCWSTSLTHKLVRDYAAEGTFNLINDEQPLDETVGWVCEWDTAATSTNQHIVGALCCSTLWVATCS